MKKQNNGRWNFMNVNEIEALLVPYLRKIKASGKKLYGILAHGLIPEELIYAAGGFPLRLILAGDKNPSTKGIEYLTSATCSFARATIGHFELKNELYSELDAIIGGNYCNGELCAIELISEYFNIPKLSIVFPSTKNEFALKFMVAELDHFKQDLERFGGIQISDEQLQNAIERYDTERDLIQEIVKIQSERGPFLSGSESLDLMYRHFLYGVDSSIEHLKQVIKELPNKQSLSKGKKILFAGNGVAFGDNIIQLIERQGLIVTKNLTWTGLDYYNSLVGRNGTPLTALARYYINAENSGRMVLSTDYFKNLTRIYEENDLDGVIFYIIKHCSIIPSLISMNLKAHLKSKEIPYLELERDYSLTSEAQLLTRIQAFKEMIE